MTHPTHPPVVIEQSLVAGGRWNGTKPSQDVSSTDQGVWIYPAENGLNGGRFEGGPPYDDGGTPAQERDMELGEPKQYLVIERAMIDATGLPGGSTWTVEIVSAAGKRWLWITGGVTTTIYSGTSTFLYLAPDEHLELKCSAVATGPCAARIQARRLGAYPSI